MSSPAPVSVPRTIWLVARGVFLELLRRKDLYVVLFFLLVFLGAVGAISVVGVENAATSNFLLNLGLSLAFGISHLLVLVLAVRQLPAEIENRTLYPLLAKPLERYALLLGKWAACAASGVFAFFLFFAAVWMFVPRLQPYEPSMLLQMLALVPVSAGLLAALGLAGTLFAPRAVVLTVAAGLLFFGGKVILLAREAAGGHWFRPVVDWTIWYLPDFSKLNLVTRFTDGIAPLAAGAFLGILVYGLLFTATALGAGIWAFQRRPL